MADRDNNTYNEIDRYWTFVLISLVIEGYGGIGDVGWEAATFYKYKNDIIRS